MFQKQIKHAAKALFLCALVTATMPLCASSRPVRLSIAPMLNKILPSVVQITVDVKKAPDEPVFDQSGSPTPTPPADTSALGTGIVIDAKKGMIVTNAHVVKNANQIFVTLKNGNRYYGNLVAADTDMDIAVLHVNAKELKALPIASMKNVHVGDYVAAVGSPFGLTQTVTTGSISALNRSEPHIGDLSDFIQTDASINPGNSGGPLVNMRGQMVGMNTALLGPSISIGLGFAIPVDIVQSAADQLIKYGNIQHGLLGVVVQPITQSLAASLKSPTFHGSLVTEVLPGSAAAKASIQTGDVITSINSVPVETAFELKTQVSLHRPGTKIHINYWHDGKQHSAKATLESQQETLSHSPAMPFVAGLQLQNLNALSAQGDSLKGLLVTDAKDHSQALLTGIAPGDVIVSIDHQKCQTIAEMKQILAVTPENQQQVLVKLYRDGKFMYVTLNR
jgi:serine protease Do